MSNQPAEEPAKTSNSRPDPLRPAPEYRYPGDAHAPEPATAEALLRAAEEIHRVVIASLASKGPNPTAKE